MAFTFNKEFAAEFLRKIEESAPPVEFDAVSIHLQSIAGNKKNGYHLCLTVRLEKDGRTIGDYGQLRLDAGYTVTLKDMAGTLPKLKIDVLNGFYVK